MRIVTAHTMVEDLRAHFERAGFRRSSDGDGTFLVSAQGDAEESKAEILLMLRVWAAMHPETKAQARD